MKKIYLLLAALMFSMASIAQNYSQHMVVDPGINQNINFKKAQALKSLEMGQAKVSPVFNNRSMGDESGVYSFFESYYSYLGTTASIYYGQTFPDTLAIKYEDNDNPGQYTYDIERFASIGAAFTPTGFIYKSYGNEILDYSQSFRLDTLVLYYGYERRIQDAGIVDTLFIDVYDQSKTYEFYDIDTEDPLFSTVVYNSSTKRGMNPTKSITRLLTADDTTTIRTSGAQALIVPLDNFIVDSNTCAVTFTFKPGYTYDITDTLNGELDPTIVNKQFNQFYFLYLSDGGYHETEELLDYNSGLWAFKFSNWTTNYWDYTSGSNTIPFYIPHYFFSNQIFPYVRWAISWDPDWVDPDAIEELNANVKISDIYPNPVVDNAKLEIELTSPEYVTVELINSLGQNVSTVVNDEFASGKHQIDVNTSGLNAGYYICKVSSGDAFVTKTMLVK